MNNLKYEKGDISIFQGDMADVLDTFDKEMVDMIFADPPYFLSSGGITCSGGKMVSVDKGVWDKSLSFVEKHEYNKEWLLKCKRIMKPNATIWISGTLHNIYSIGAALEETGFKILNNITWQKTNPPPNLGCRNFTHSTETIIWAKKESKKSKHYFDYQLMKSYNDNKQMKDVWTGPLTPKREKKFGKHPTQKPLYLLERIIEASTKQGDLILDPFLGSGTTGVAAKKLQRKFIGIEVDEVFIDIAKNRIENTEEEPKLL